MSTVALRGTLIPPPKVVSNADGSENAGFPPTSCGAWQWKGMWGFGSSLTSASAQSQQPFFYTFQKPIHPSEVEIPGIVINEEEQEEDDETNVGSYDGDGSDEAIAAGGEGEAPISAAVAASVDTNKSHECLPSASTTHGEGEKSTEVDSNEGGKKEANSSPQRLQEPSSGIDTEIMEGEKANVGLASKAAATTKHDPGAVAEQKDATRAAEENTEDANTAHNNNSTTSKNKKPTFATVPDGFPTFTDACQHYRDKTCPASGQWQGYFQNAAASNGPGRPRADKQPQVQKVKETFFLFFNATPGPTLDDKNGIQYFFDDTPLPPTVHKESLVLVRGMGTNPFGTFELIGYYDLSSQVVEIQRQYVLLPMTPRIRRGNGGRGRGGSPSSATTTTASSYSNNNSNMTTRHNQRKSYFTRKRQPTWKRKSLEEQEEEFVSKRQRVGGSGPGSSKKGSKSVRAAGDSGSTMTEAVFGLVPGQDHTAVAYSGAPFPPDSTPGFTTMTMAPGTIIPPASSGTNTTSTSGTIIPLSSGAGVALPGSMPFPTPPPINGPVNPSTSSIASFMTAHPGLTITATPSSTSSTGTKRSKKTRKRTSSVGSIKSNASASSTMGGGVASGSGNTYPNGTFLKLPPVGEPKKARWRAAHFLYYQRHDPDDAFPEISNGPNGTITGSSGKSGTPSASSNTATPNPRYVVYEGEMVNSQREGRGICLYSNNMLYEGEWKRNKEHGRGQLWTADRRRLIYDGEWERGRIQGRGTYHYGTGTSNTASSSKSGPPTLHPSGGSRYTGEFKENMRNGAGQYILPDGSVYDGMWNQGKMNGRGVFTWPDHSVYDGEWKDGERHGQGLLKTSDGFVYDGMWVHNAMEGRGVATYPNGQTYEGLFANGRREGRGTMRFTNGAVYEGRFRDDAIDGQGTMKMSRAMLVPHESDEDEDGGGGGDAGEVTKPNNDKEAMETKRSDFMIPIYFQSDMTHIHAKAGFTAVGD